MQIAKAIFFFVIIPILVLSAFALFLVYRQDSAEEAKKDAEAQALQAELDTPEGYAKLRIQSGLGVRANQKRQVYIDGPVTNHGDRALKDVYIRLQYFTKSGKPKGKGKVYRLGAFKPKEQRAVDRIDLYTLDKEDYRPDPMNPGVLTAPLPPYKITVEKVKFAD